MKIITEEQLHDLYEIYMKRDVTIRELAKMYGISKSALHTNFNKYLLDLEYDKYKEKAKEKKYKGQIKGGQRTKVKYMYKRNIKNNIYNKEFYSKKKDDEN